MLYTAYSAQTALWKNVLQEELTKFDYAFVELFLSAEKSPKVLVGVPFDYRNSFFF